MTTKLTITAKGQVTLRKEVLTHLGVQPGDKLEVELLSSGRAQVRAANETHAITGFFGCLKRSGTKSVSIKRIGEIAAEGWAGRR
jgi:bifunctional DNA-binding transcriptional regulator/antitoxin component of YhaV-PrlF toxin-antitoxin module